MSWMRLVRLNVSLDQVLYRRLKSRLALRGLSIAAWVRQQAQRLTGKEEK